MRSGLTRTLSFLAVAGAGLAGVAGCGGDDPSSNGDLPSNGVARIGDIVVKRSEFDKGFKLIALSPFLGGDAFVGRAPDPPSFSNCVAAKKAQERTASDTQLRKQCAREYSRLKSETMELLIRSEWLRQEAAARNIHVSQSETARLFAGPTPGGFPNEAAYRRFLEAAGMTERDFRLRLRLNLLQEKLDQAIKNEVSKVADRELRAYYEDNQKRFMSREQRNFTFVVTKTKAGAEKAKQAVERGLSWKAAVRMYSIDPEHSEARAIQGPTLEDGQEALERAVRATKRGEIGGPVRAKQEWYVFEVTNVTPPQLRPFGEVKPQVEESVRAARGETAIAKFEDAYRKRTVCADAFHMPLCN